MYTMLYVSTIHSEYVHVLQTRDKESKKREEELSKSIIGKTESEELTVEEAPDVDVDTKWLDFVNEDKLKELKKVGIDKKTLSRKLNKERKAFYAKVENLLDDNQKKHPVAKAPAQNTDN